MLQFIFILVFVFIFFRILYGFYVDYKNDHNQLIQRIRKDLFIYPPLRKILLVIYEGDQSYTYNSKNLSCLYDENGKQYPYDSIIVRFMN